MTCETALELISAALDGELTVDEQAQLDHHLAQCSSCRALSDELSALHCACEGLEVAPPPELRACILNGLPAQNRPAKVVFIRWRRWAVMAASFALVMMAAWNLPKVLTKPAAPPQYAGVSPALDLQTNGASPAPDPQTAADSAESDPEAVTASSEDTQADASSENVPASDAPSETAPLPAVAAASPAANAEPLPKNAGYETGETNTAAQPSSGILRSAPQAAGGVAMTDAFFDGAVFASEVPESVAEKKIAVQGVTSSAIEADEAAVPYGSARLATFSVKVADGTEDDAVPEPHPEIGAEENAAVELTPTDCAEYQLCYCGVLTVQGPVSLTNCQPTSTQEDGTTHYELPYDAFFALLRELQDGDIAFDLRTSGDDISSAAETGLVIVSP